MDYLCYLVFCTGENHFSVVVKCSHKILCESKAVSSSCYSLKAHFRQLPIVSYNYPRGSYVRTQMSESVAAVSPARPLVKTLDNIRVGPYENTPGDYPVSCT